MKHIILLIILAFSTQVHAGTNLGKDQCNSFITLKNYFFKINQTSNQAVSNAFKRSVTHYPYETKLLQNVAVKQRLIKLIGMKNYNLLLSYHVQGQVEFMQGYYHCWFGQPHLASNCFHIYYHTEGNFTVFLTIDDDTWYWQEKKDNYILSRPFDY